MPPTATTDLLFFLIFLSKILFSTFVLDFLSLLSNVPKTKVVFLQLSEALHNKINRHFTGFFFFCAP